MKKFIHHYKLVISYFTIVILFQGCCVGDAYAPTEMQTTLLFKSLDSNYIVNHLFIQEIGYSTKNNFMLDSNMCVLPLNNKQLTIYCFAKSGKVDTIVLNNIYKLVSSQNSYSCGDDSYINYKRTEISISSNTFSSASIIYGGGNYSNSYNNKLSSLFDTLLFKP